MSESLFQPVGAVAEHVDRSELPAAGDADAEDGAAKPSTQLAAGDMMALKSLCMGCGETGITNLLLITIPFFRNVIIMAFECEHCGLRNSEVQAAEVQEKGCRFEVKIETKRVRARRADCRAAALVECVGACAGPEQAARKERPRLGAHPGARL